MMEYLHKNKNSKKKEIKKKNENKFLNLDDQSSKKHSKEIFDFKRPLSNINLEEKKQHPNVRVSKFNDSFIQNKNNHKTSFEILEKDINEYLHNSFSFGNFH